MTPVPVAWAGFAGNSITVASPNLPLNQVLAVLYSRSISNIQNADEPSGIILTINGSAALMAADGTYLGLVSSNRNDSNSICNPNGQYGSSWSQYSVRNEFGQYGGQFGIYSPYNSFCLNPPAIIYQNRVVLRVTKNKFYLSPEGVLPVEPDFLFGVLLSASSYAQPAAYTAPYSGGFAPPATLHSSFTVGAHSYGQAQSNNPEVWYNQGNKLLNSQKYEEAIAAYKQAIQIKPDLIEAWNNGGLALANLQRYEEAIAAYDKVIQINPNFAMAWDNKGLALAQLKRYEEALIAYDQAIQAKGEWGSGNSANAWFHRGNALLELQRDEEALTSFEKAVQIEVDFLEAWYNKGIVLRNLQRYEDAYASFERVTQLNFDFIDAWFNRGLASFNLKQYEEAVTSFDRVIQFKPDLAEAWLLRSSALRELQRYAEAFVCSDRCIQLNPDLPEGWVVRGVVLAKLQQHEEAITACDKAIQIKPDNPAGWYGKACCYALQGNVEVAVKNLKWSTDLDSKYREIAKTDSTFDAIRQDERFKHLTDG